MAMDLPRAALLSQHARLIELDTSYPAGLVVERLTGVEGVCADFRFDIDCLSTSAFIDRAALLAGALVLRLRTADGGHRHWHGYCTGVESLGSDGGLARYRLVMEPWTAFLRLRRDALIFQGLDAIGVLERIAEAYPQAALKVDVGKPLHAPDITTQYRESDHEFVFRLLADAGLAWRFEHRQRGAHGGDAGHELVVFDREAEVPQARPPVLRFHRADATEGLDGLAHFTDLCQSTAGTLATTSWQPRQVAAVGASVAGETAGPHLPNSEVFMAGRSGRFPQRDLAEAWAGHQLDALRLQQRLHAGSGSGRGIEAGAAFVLSQHPDLSGLQFVPLAVEHVAANNLGSGISALAEAPDIERGSYRNRFVAVPAGTPIVPLARRKPTAPGAQTARVVGMPGAAVTSSRDHQVRIQFGWQRGTCPNPGGLAAGGKHDDGHAPGDDTSGTWVRVAEWLAGPNWGSHALPRVGSEVLVEFLHGDIDQPIIVGQLYNGDVAPPFALADASNHPGTMSGLHSRSLDGSGTQQWLMDDATGQLRQRLHTSLGDSRLELGHLLEHRDASRGRLRGQGFDLATLGWANVRGGEGVLLSSTARADGNSTQMDVAEAVSQLKGAERMARALSDAAEDSEVAPLAANARQKGLIKQVDPEQDGSYTGAVNGQPATKPRGSRRDGGDAVDRFAAPLLFADSPDAIALATPASAVAYAGGNTHATVQQDAHLAAGHTFAGVGGGQVALFAQAGPLKAIAANGPLSLQAHAGPLELLADQSVTVTATDERIDVLAKEKVVLQAGQSEIVLEGGDITFKCPGTFVVKAGQVPFRSGATGHAEIHSLPSQLLLAPIICGLQPGASTKLRTPALPASPRGTGSSASIATHGPTSAQSAPAASALGPRSAVCSNQIPAHATRNYSPEAGCKDYHETDANGQKVLDTTATPPRPIELNFGGVRGRFDISYSPLDRKITAGITVKLIFVDWHRTDPGGTILQDANGSPISAPFDSDQETDVAIGAVNIIEVVRPPSMQGTSPLKARIEQVLNQNRYKLTPAACALGAGCSCDIDIDFDVSFVLTGEHHEVVKMFPRAVRANSGSLGEVSVERNPSPSAALLQPYVPTTVDHVGAHELGHLFGWPDEYFLHGGAVHSRYIGTDKAVDVTMLEPVDDWQRESPTNLMGRGMWSPAPSTPKYYMNHIRDWFNSKTGLLWEVSI